MTIPALPIPNVTPGAVQQAPGFAEQVAPGLSALANVLALRQRRAELDQQQQELAFRVDQAKMEAKARGDAGEVLRRQLTALDTDLTPGMIPLAFGGAAPINVPQPGALARSVMAAPPGAVYDAVRLGSGIIAEAFNRRAKAQAEVTGVKPDTAYSVDAQGYAIFKTADPVTGRARARHVLKNPDGPDNPSNWVREEIPGQGSGGQAPGQSYLDAVITDPGNPNYGGYTRVPLAPGQVLDTKRLYPVAQIKVDNQSAADFVPNMVTAYEQTRNTMPHRPGEQEALSTFVGALNAGDPDQSAWNILIADKTLSPETKRWMQSMLSLVAAFVYKASGKAVTKGEFSRFLQFNAPLPYEDEATREQKWTRIEGQMDSYLGQARPAMALRGIRPPDWTGLRTRLATERAQKVTLRQLQDQVKNEHPNWTPEQRTNEALRRWRAQQPVVAPGGP